VSKTLQTARVKCAWTMVCIVASLAIAQDSALHIKVVAGDGVQNAAGSHGKPLTVEVTDATGRPVAGARVSFQVPEEGPGGLFANGLRTDIAITDSNGRATAHGLQLNRVAGSVAIRITAAKEQQRAGTIARQFIGNAETATGSADRKAPAPASPALASKEPVPAPAPAPAPTPAPALTPATVPQRQAIQPPTITMPGTTATGPVKVAAQPAPPIPAVKAAAELPHGVPTIIVTQKSSKSITEVGADSPHKSHRKLIWIGLLAAGGAGAFFAEKSIGAAGHGETTGAATSVGLSSGVTIGTPTITIGKP
jgi:hypothetical protein